MNWIYPEEGHEWKEGEEIVAEFEYKGATDIALLRWFPHDGGFLYSTSHHLANDIGRIIAYMPYTKPEPPETEKPQDCPFCGAEMQLRQLGDTFYYRCGNDGHASCLITPERETKAEAIKALNSVRVESEE